MANPDALMRSALLVERRLTEPLSVQDMADAACWSLHHFSRVFTEALGMGPYDYLMRRRISEAAKELLAHDRRILDVALTYEFASPEVFTRCFRRALGVLPSRTREEWEAALPRLLPPLTRELAELVAERFTRPRVTRETTGAVELSGQATLLECPEETPLAELDVVPDLHRVLAATATREDASWSAVLCRTAGGLASLYLGMTVVQHIPVAAFALPKSIPTFHCLRVAAPAGAPAGALDLGNLRRYFHNLWYPAADMHRDGEMEVFRCTGCGDGTANTELLVPLRPSLTF